MTQVGTKRIDYRSLSQEHVQPSIKEYRKFIVGTIKANPKFLYVLGNEELIGELITELGMAAWRFDKTKGMKLESFLYQSIIFYLRKQQMKMYKTGKLVYWPDFSYTGSEDNNPEQILRQEEDISEKRELAAKLVNNAALTTLERDYMKLFFLEEMPVSKIAEKYNRSRQGVDAKIKNAIKKLKQEA